MKEVMIRLNGRVYSVPVNAATTPHISHHGTKIAHNKDGTARIARNSSPFWKKYLADIIEGGKEQSINLANDTADDIIAREVDILRPAVLKAVTSSDNCITNHDNSSSFRTMSEDVYEVWKVSQAAASLILYRMVHKLLGPVSNAREVATLIKDAGYESRRGKDVSLDNIVFTNRDGRIHTLSAPWYRKSRVA